MCPGVICVRKIMCAVAPEVMYAISNAMRWDTVPVSVLRVCLENSQCKGQVLLELEELVDFQLLQGPLGREVKLVELHKLRRGQTSVVGNVQQVRIYAVTDKEAEKAPDVIKGMVLFAVS